MASAHLFAAFFALGLAGCSSRSDGTKNWGGPFVAVSAERSATCAIQRAGDVVCWGDSRTGKPPAGPFREIAFNERCAVGLRPTGEIEGWGESCAAPPAGDYVAISAQHEACAIRKDGDIVCWGFIGGVYRSPSGRMNPLPPTAPKVTRGPFTRVAQGASHTCAIQASGALRCWGSCAFRDNKTTCLLYTSPSPRDRTRSRMPSSA